MNSDTNDYPTAAVLQFSFANTVSGVSFLFHNYGPSLGGGAPGDSIAQAFDGSNNLLETIGIDNISSTAYNFTASGIRSIQFNNRTGGTESWLFSVENIRFDSALPSTATPVPATVLFAPAIAVLLLASRKGRFVSN